MGKSLDDILKKMRTNSKAIRFSDLVKICDSYFGKSRQNGGNHRIYKTPWPNEPRVNIQSNKGKAKAYQVKQVLLAIDKLGRETND